MSFSPISTPDQEHWTKCNDSVSNDITSVSSSHSLQRPSTGRRRTKFWSSIWDGDNKKSQRPRTSPPTPSSWMSSTHHSSCGGTSNRVGSLEERQPPFSATVSSSGSKLGRYWQWPGKRLSLFKPSSSVQTTTVSPSKTYFPSSPSVASSMLPTPTSPSPASMTSQGNHTCIRSTPNLQPPDLSLEELGKVNARYAPLPSTLRVSGDLSHRQAVLSKTAPESSKRLLLPISSSIPALSTLPLPAVPTQASSHYRRGIPIALPLSPVESLDGGESFTEEGGVFYLTVEDVLDEESGEASLRLVEIPK